MQKTILVLVFTISTTFGYTQADLLLLKKHHKTIETFYAGSYINCRINNGEWIDAHISGIANDTLYLKTFELIHYINAWGMPAVDTLWRTKRKIAIKSIDAFPREDQSVSYIRNGGILQIGGAGYILLNVVNTLTSHDDLFDNNNAVHLGIAAAIFAVGTLIHRSHSPVLLLGKTYKVRYIKFNPS